MILLPGRVHGSGDSTNQFINGLINVSEQILRWNETAGSTNQGSAKTWMYAMMYPMMFDLRLISVERAMISLVTYMIS